MMNCNVILKAYVKNDECAIYNKTIEPAWMLEHRIDTAKADVDVMRDIAKAWTEDNIYALRAFDMSHFCMHVEGQEANGLFVPYVDPAEYRGW